jgi:hypothetical protein
MEPRTRGTRGETTQPPPRHEVIRTQDRCFPVCLHLEHPDHPGASTYKRPEGRIVLFAKRTSAILYLYQHQRDHPMHQASTEGSAAYVDRSRQTE